MLYRKYLLITLLLSCLNVKAQEPKYQQADSTTLEQYKTGNWQQLISFGERTIAAGTDFPLLRLRIAYAFFNTQNYTSALQQYDHVLASDPQNQTARYYAYWSNRYLNRFTTADYHASFIDKKLLSGYDLLPFGLLNIGLETNLKFPEDRTRSAASYTRVFLGNRLGWRLQLEQSLAYYNQINNDDFRYFRLENPNERFDNDQFEYYGKLNYSLNKNLVLLGAYHYLYTNQANNMGLFGLKMTQNQTILQADFNYSYLNGKRYYQYNTKLEWNPMGNLDFYTITRAVLQRTAESRFIFNQIIGGKMAQDFWLEGNATFGRQDNYLEADGLYIYNFVDATTFKTGATAYFQLNPHLLLPLTYMFERKNNLYRGQDYNQHSITAALTWRF